MATNDGHHPLRGKAAFEAVYGTAKNVAWETKEVIGGDTNYGLKCPKEDCDTTIWLKSKTQYCNVVSHLQSCIGPDAIHAMAEERRASAVKQAGQKKGSISHFVLNGTQREKAIHSWIDLVVNHNVPPSKCRDKNYRKHLKFGDVNLSTKVILDTMFQLSLIVEEKIKKMLKGKKVALLHDGWSRHCVHYLCILASYMPDDDNQAQDPDAKAALVMLSLKTLRTAADDEDEDDIAEDDEATDYGAKTHAHHFKTTCQHYDMKLGGDARDVACFVADNTNLNPAAARLCGTPHVACRPHGLNTAGNDMEDANEALKSVADTLHACHTKMRSNKMSAKLRNLQRREIQNGHRKRIENVKIRAATRWNALCTAFTSHLKLRETIAVAATSAGNDVVLPNEHEVRRHHEYLDTLRQLSVALQKPGLDIAEATDYIDGVIGLSEEGENGFDAVDFDYTKISLEGNKDSDKKFVSGVIKIINKNEGDMDAEEKERCKCLLLSPESADNAERGEPGAPKANMFEQISKKRKIQAGKKNFKSKYHCCKFIVASASPVESVWSKGDCILTKRRASMSPVTFELIMFLNYNKHLWDLNDVIKANKVRLMKNIEGRAAERAAAAQAAAQEWNDMNVFMGVGDDYDYTNEGDVGEM